ncbi:hypothetical protein, partial [Xanthomonas translucens]|uniref:hypothetical protein n=1 Tax=Xanthomonas campestris pv. translucens TaxID=343 RepID=UPI001E3D822A
MALHCGMHGSLARCAAERRWPSAQAAVAMGRPARMRVGPQRWPEAPAETPAGGVSAASSQARRGSRASSHSRSRQHGACAARRLRASVQAGQQLLGFGTRRRIAGGRHFDQQ